MENSARRISNRLAIAYRRGEYKIKHDHRECGRERKGTNVLVVAEVTGHRSTTLICIQFYLNFQNLFTEFLPIFPIVISASIKGYCPSLPTWLSTANKHDTRTQELEAISPLPKCRQQRHTAGAYLTWRHILDQMWPYNWMHMKWHSPSLGCSADTACSLKTRYMLFYFKNEEIKNKPTYLFRYYFSLPFHLHCHGHS